MNTKECIIDCLKKAKDFAEEYDAIIVASSYGDFQQSSIKDFDIFEK